MHGLGLIHVGLQVDGKRIHDYPQSVTSARTCRRIRSRGSRLILDMFGNHKGLRVLDFGGGRWDDGASELLSAGMELRVYDPYNRTPNQNAAALSFRYDVVMCNNVLNVLTDDVLPRAVGDMRKVCHHVGAHTVLVTVYERDRTGRGGMTGPDEYQRNEPLTAYQALIARNFRNVRIHHRALWADVTPDRGASV